MARKIYAIHTELIGARVRIVDNENTRGNRCVDQYYLGCEAEVVTASTDEEGVPVYSVTPMGTGEVETPIMRYYDWALLVIEIGWRKKREAAGGA